MKKVWIVAAAIVLVVLIFGSMYVSARNTMVRKDEAIKSDWAQVSVVLERRADLIPNLVATVKGVAAQEVTVFTAVANANPAEKADLLSASISVAMNTTAFGLMVAIPLLVVHAVLTSKTGDIVDSLEMASVKALSVITRRAKRQFEVAA